MPVESSYANLAALNPLWPLTNTDDARYGAEHIRGVKTAVQSLTASGGAAQIGVIHSVTGAVARTMQAKARDFLSPEDGGCAADGTTDDTTAFVALMGRGKPVDGGGRTVAVTGIVQLGGIVGLKNITLKQLDPSVASARTLYINNIDDFFLDNVKIDRNAGFDQGTATDNAGIYISNCDRFTLRNVEVYNGGPGAPIGIHTCNDFILDGCIVRDHTHDIGASDDAINGILCDASSNFTLKGCLSHDLVGDGTVRYTRGFAFSGCSSFAVTGCVANGVDQGFDISGQDGNSNFTFSGNVASNCGTRGFKFANSSTQGVVSGCVASDCGLTGFVVSGPTHALNPLPRDVEFVGCMAIDTGSNGVWAGQNIVGFRVQNAGAGIDISYPRGVRFTNCSAIDTQGSATMLYGFYNDVDPIGPTSTGYDQSDSNVCVNCVSIGHVTGAYFGIHFQAGVYAGTGTANTPDSTWTQVDLADTEIYDPAALHSTATNPSNAYAKTPGLYWVFGTSGFSNNTTGVRRLRFAVNGSGALSPVFEFAPHATGVTTVQGGAVIPLNAGQSIRMEVWQNSGGGLNHDKAKSSLSLIRIA